MTSHCTWGRWAELEFVLYFIRRSHRPPEPVHRPPSEPVHRPPVSSVWSSSLQLHSDVDTGDGQVRYVLTGEGAASIFTIDESTGDIHATRRLDREQQAYYTLRAQARDRLTDRLLEPESQFVIKVQDVNDNQPRFLDGPYTARVPERSPVGESLGLRPCRDQPDAAVFQGRRWWQWLPRTPTTPPTETPPVSPIASWRDSPTSLWSRRQVRTRHHLPLRCGGVVRPRGVVGNVNGACWVGSDLGGMACGVRPFHICRLSVFDTDMTRFPSACPHRSHRPHVPTSPH